LIVSRADERHGTIPRMVRAIAPRFGTRDAIVDGEVRLSFADVESGMFAVARSLLARGVTRGDRVALWAPNSASWITIALGIQAVGAWLVPLNTRLKGDEAAFVLDKADARLLFAADGFLGTDYAGAVRAVAPSLRAVGDAVAVPLPGQSTAPRWDAFLAEGEVVPRTEVEASIAAGSPDDVSDVIFTSGTTGTPKGVMLRHGATLRGYELIAERFGLGEGDRYLIPTPFFHCFGYKAGWLISLLRGATGFPLAVFDADVVLELLERERITHFPGPPTMFSAILDHPRRAAHDLSSLKYGFVGAATIPEVLVRRMRDELHVPSILSAYALTENHAICTATAPDDDPETVATTVGRPLPEVELLLVDDDGDEVPVGEDGEILIRSPFRMTGYFEEPEATAAVLVDGWLHTGDVGRLDERGYLRITDRKKDLFIVGGFNVAPAEVEKALAGCPGVGQVAVVGMPDDYFGEVGAAFVVPRDGAALTVDDVLAYARTHLANFKVPRRVEIVDALPVNATGKVLKGELRARLRDGSNTSSAGE
jgi:acyl-CoA synthetase (AMP-forming)/AMP-acid ligase II